MKQRRLNYSQMKERYTQICPPRRMVDSFFEWDSHLGYWPRVDRRSALGAIKDICHVDTLGWSTINGEVVDWSTTQMLVRHKFVYDDRPVKCDWSTIRMLERPKVVSGGRPIRKGLLMARVLVRQNCLWCSTGPI